MERLAEFNVVYADRRWLSDRACSGAYCLASIVRYPKDDSYSLAFSVADCIESNYITHAATNLRWAIDIIGKLQSILIDVKAAIALGKPIRRVRKYSIKGSEKKIFVTYCVKRDDIKVSIQSIWPADGDKEARVYSAHLHTKGMVHGDISRHVKEMTTKLDVIINTIDSVTKHALLENLIS